MAIHRRSSAAFDLVGLGALGAVRRSGDVVVGFDSSVTPDLARDTLGADLKDLKTAPGITLATVASLVPELHSEPAETGLLENRNVVMAFRGEETPKAVRDWLHWHQRFLGADAALIYDTPGSARAPISDTDLAPVADAMTILLIDGDVSLTDGNLALVELMRHRFLARARAVASLSIGDLTLQDRLGTPFDRAAALDGEALPMAGTEVFPWRLRQGKPAHHGDHVAKLRNDEKRLSGWCVAPQGCPDKALWCPDHIAGQPFADVPPTQFRRAMGVVRPGVTVGKLVRKSDLVEDPALVEMMTGAFGQRPPAEQPGRRAHLKRVPDDRQVAIVTTMKNEGPFILDWIAHHRVTGVERFLVYTNDCDDGTVQLLDLLSDAGVTRRDNPFRRSGGVPQHAAFRAANQEPVVQGAAWLLTLDVDEFLNIRPGQGRLPDLFDAVPDIGAISMPWRLFGNADKHGYVDKPVTQQFHLSAPEYAPRPLQAWAFKTLYRNDGTFGRLGVHRPKELDRERSKDLRWVDGTGRALPARMWRGGWRMTPETWGYDLAGVNHYAVRSAESFLVKRDRGRANHVDRDQGTAYWFRMNHNVTEDRSIRRLDRAVAGERERLAALPGVAEAHGRAVTWHRARIAALRANPDQAALFAEITGPRLEKLSRMTPNFGSRVFYAGPEVIPDEVLARDAAKRFYFTI